MSHGEDPEGEIPRSVAPEALLRGYTPGNFPLRVLPGELALLFFQPS